ncbi:hypothetical protein pb186bvf_012231 [Paramecium bursaria]
MRSMIALMMIALVFGQSISQPQLEVELTKADAQQFLIGFALGFGVVYAIPDALSCVSNITGAQAAVAKAVAQIKAGGVENIIHGIQGLTHLADAVSQSCGKTTLEGLAFINSVRVVVTDPHVVKIITGNVAKNIGVAIKDVQAIISEDEWLFKGAYAGDLAKIIVFGEPNDN